jgi:TonB-dependent starch-binding outer membrane protein SusC
MIKKLPTLLIVFILSIATMFGQQGTISGKVVDQDNMPAIFANVSIAGTTIGATTDLDGKYSIASVDPGTYTVAVSFIGYKTAKQEVTVTANQISTVDFTMEEDVMQLDELVVIGYGSKRKRDVTSSITRVKADEMENVSVTNFESVLQGRTTGVQVTTDNGLAGGAVTLRVRGTSSMMASSEPLYVVDGVPIVTGSLVTDSDYPDKANALSQIDPNDIESIEVLKDASAAAIYGARASNGVVLITTKKGKEGKTKFNFGYYTGISDVTNRLDILDADQYLDLTQEAYLNTARDPESALYGDTLVDDPGWGYWGTLPSGIDREMAESTNTDWIDEMLRVGKVQNFNFSASGGSKKTKFYVGGAFRDEEGVMISNAFERANGRINLEHQATDKVRFGANIALTNTKNNRVQSGWAGGLGTAQSRSLPIIPAYDSLGNYFEPRNGVNMLAEDENRDYVANATSVLGNVFAEYSIFDNLFLRTDIGLNNVYQKEDIYEAQITREDARAKDRRNYVNTWNSNTTLNYSKSIDVHTFSALVGFSAQENHTTISEITGEKFPSETLRNPQNAERQTIYSDEQEYGFVSYMARFAYSFNDRYLIDFSVRRDASSRFGKDKQWGMFPAGSIGWIISDEEFMSSVPYLSFLKLRASYGITGNAEIGNYRRYGTFNTTLYNGVSGIEIANIANNSLHWEQTGQLDIGLEYGFLDGRISGGFDYYYKRTTDMLMDVNIPQTSGSSNIVDNVGEMENKGFEFFITSRNLVGDLKWTTDINFARNQNEIIDINGQIISGNDAGGTYGNNYAVEGEPIGSWRLVRWAGVDPLTGEAQFYDVDGNITKEYNFDRDAVSVGNPYPDLYGGITNTFEYKGFDLSILFTFSWGNDVYRDDGKFFEGGNIGNAWNQMTTILDRWQNPGDVTDQPQLRWDSRESTYNTTKHLNDASYIRLKTLSLGYTIPRDITKKVNIDKARIYVNGQNILTFTDYIGWDPEVNRDNSANVTQGVTYLSPPQVKTWTFGVTLDF